MLSFPCCKINIGLNIVEKRADGFHNIETIFYPVKLFDGLEFVEKDEFNFTNSGLNIDCDVSNNLVYKAFKLLKDDFNLPNINIYLHKVIPFGSGLGGASSDAASMLKMLNEYFELSIKTDELENYARKLGSDCAFFIDSVPKFAENKGDKFSEVNLNLNKYFIYIIYPNFKINTAKAYSTIRYELINHNKMDLREAILKPIEEWKDLIFNDFELNIFEEYPILKEIKEELYSAGSLYSSLSGSGSAIYAIFGQEINLQNIFKNKNFQIFKT